MDNPPWQTMDNHWRRTHVLHISSGFQTDNPVTFDIKEFLISGLRDKLFDGQDTKDPWEHLDIFYEMCLMYKLDDVTKN